MGRYLRIPLCLLAFWVFVLDVCGPVDYLAGNEDFNLVNDWSKWPPIQVKNIEWDQALSAVHVFGRAECDFSMEPPIKPRPDGTYPVRIPSVSRLDQ